MTLFFCSGLLAEKQCQSVDRLEGEKKNKMINMCPKCVCLGKSLMVIFLSSSEKKKLHILYSLALYQHQKIWDEVRFHDKKGMAKVCLNFARDHF